MGSEMCIRDRAEAVGYSYRVGENINGHRDGAFKAVETWMNSPGHRANILNPDYVELGVGYFYQNADATYTQKFGTPWLI